MDDYNGPEAEPDPVPAPDGPDPGRPLHPGVPPESTPKTPAEPGVPDDPVPVPLPPKGPA